MLFGPQGGADFSRDVPGVLFIEYIFDGEKHVVRLPCAVDVIGDRDKADAPLGEIPLQESSGLDIVSAEAG